VPAPVLLVHSEPLVALPDGAMVAHTKQYRILGCIGEGGMGYVYRAYDEVLERDVAIKVMKSDVPEHERRRFRQEALYGARFCHPSIARVYDLVGVPGQGISWFAMEYLPGRDLEDVIERAAAAGRAIPLRLVGDVFRQVLGALQYSHDCRVVHRDVKPANVFVTRDPNTRFVTTKLLDFGVALDLGRNAAAETRLVGDPRYMAPEQARLHAAIDARADIYAAGMSLYQMVTGRHPFADLMDGHPRELLRAHRERMPAPLSHHLPLDFDMTIACGLDVVFDKATAKDPERRFDSARDMSEALRDVLDALLPGERRS
jgi:serine/threonine-protein kinase